MVKAYEDYVANFENSFEAGDFCYVSSLPSQPRNTASVQCAAHLSALLQYMSYAYNEKYTVRRCSITSVNIASYDTVNIVQSYATKFDDVMNYHRQTLDPLDGISRTLTKFVGLPIGVFVNREYNCLVILVGTQGDNGASANPEFITMAVPFFVKDFKKSKYDLICALLKKVYDGKFEEYKECIAPCLDMEKAKLEKLRNDIKGFCRSGYDTQISAVQSQIEATNREIERLSRQLSDKISMLNDLRVESFGLLKMADEANKDDDLLEFLTAQKAIKNISVVKDDYNGKMIHFDVKTTLRNFEPDFYDAGIATKRATWWFPSSKEFDHDALMKAWKHLFKDRDYVVKMYMRFVVDGSANVSFNAGGTAKMSADGYVANPHLLMNNCFGGYREGLNNARMTASVEDAIRVCMTSTASVNLNENASARFLAMWLTDFCKVKCIVNKRTKEEISFKELCELKE